MKQTPETADGTHNLLAISGFYKWFNPVNKEIGFVYIDTCVLI